MMLVVELAIPVAMLALARKWAKDHERALRASPPPPPVVADPRTSHVRRIPR